MNFSLLDWFFNSIFYTQQGLQGQVDTLTEQLKRYKRSLKAYARKLKEAGGKYNLIDFKYKEIRIS